MSTFSVVALASTGAQTVGNVQATAQVSQVEAEQSNAGELLEQMQLLGTLPSKAEDEKEMVQTESAQVDATLEASTVEATTQEIQAEQELVIATVDNYVNIRDKAGLDGNVVGKLYQNSVGTMEEETPDGWYRIRSGSVEGYVKAEYVLRGEEAKTLAAQVGQRLAIVHTTTLKVRMDPSTDAKVLGLVPDGDTLAVTEEVDGWVKVVTEEGEGYVSTDYVEVYTKNVEAESIQEEQERLAKEEQERRLAQEAANQELARAKASAASSKSKASATVTQEVNNTQAEVAVQSASSAQPVTAAPVENQTAAVSSIGNQIADYGLQFVGNPYVYGGTSLTSGADCSGFIMSVYQHFGISLPRTSGEQGQSGSAVSGLENAVPGDLIWYSGHIGIYIGNGQIVHASNAADGIKVSSATCMKILSIRRIV